MALFVFCISVQTAMIFKRTKKNTTIIYTKTELRLEFRYYHVQIFSNSNDTETLNNNKKHLNVHSQSLTLYISHIHSYSKRTAFTYDNNKKCLLIIISNNKTTQTIN